ncbi:MAG: hypothetical protein K2J25_04865 [Oscillospiraceae bacterium]|nr:hypothetical protein [Oscillospiraceae bacterium]
MNEEKKSQNSQKPQNSQKSQISQKNQSSQKPQNSKNSQKSKKSKKSKKAKRKQQRLNLILLTALVIVSAGLVTSLCVIQAQKEKMAENPQITPTQEPETTPTEPETQETTEAPDPNALLVEQTLENMTLEQKIYQLFIVTPEVLVDNAVDYAVQSGSMTQQALLEKPVGGMIYFSQNIESESQITQMISNAQQYMQDANQISMWIGVDEEGGTVARVADNLGTTQYSDMAFYGANSDTQEVFEIGQTIAKDISQFGFNLDFAPVADVTINPQNELQDRIFSDDATVVSEMVASITKGLQSSGKVSATLKHFPGLGAEDGNTHNDTFTHVERTYEELKETEFLPFQAGIEAGADFVMVGHQIMSCAEDAMPSDLSSVVVTDWLRGDLGFDGIVITDAQNMNTISENYSAGEAAVLSISAGVDIVLMPVDLNDAFEGVYQAVQNGKISEERIDESIRRILTVKAKHNLL